MRELADELGVTESRISQLRSQALGMLRDGMNSQLAPDLMPNQAVGVAAGRREAFYANIAGRSSYRARLSMPGASAAYAAGSRSLDVLCESSSRNFSGPLAASR